MRRGFIVFLLMVMQFQFVWGAAASYCGHETDPAASQHFGHHEHRHQATDDGANPSGAFDLDCGSCHFGTSVTVPPSAIAMADLPRSDYHPGCSPDYSSHFPSGLERPDRSSHLAA